MQTAYYNPQHSASFGGKPRLQENFGRKKVDLWLPTQLTYSLHKPIRKKFPTRQYRVGGLNELWQMDMLEMIPYAKINKGYKYILVSIDVFSRFARALPCKTKSGAEVCENILKLIKNGGNVVPRCIQTDLGKEFYNSQVRVQVLEKFDIRHYSVTSQFKAPIVERFNRTLREKMNRYFTHSGKKVWHQVLPDLVETYNHTKHRGIFNYKPVDITAKSGESTLWHLQNQESSNKKYPIEKDLKLNDYVRISNISVEHHFNKNFDQNWSDEVFRVIRVDKKVKPTMYTIEDEKHNVIVGKFYKAELQCVYEKPTVYRIEKILQTKGTGSYKQYLVKWHGYTSEHNSWISATQIDKQNKGKKN